MSELRGNKGEWSEVYVFLKLLAEGKLFAADEKLQAIPNVFYPILTILRSEHSRKLKYNLNGDINVVDGRTNNVLLTISVEEFVLKSRELYQSLNSSKGRSLAFYKIEQFLNDIFIHSLTNSKADKSDIRIVVHDSYTGLNPELGFSIKSMIGGKSTLFNPGKNTNFVYSIHGADLTSELIHSINSITEAPMISKRIERLRQLGAEFEFFDITSSNFKLNLQLIDGDLPEILSYLVLSNYSLNIHKLPDLVNVIREINPLGYDLSCGHPFYEYKIKNFLTDVALGMTPAALWKGQYDATGGIIIVKQDGDIVCYHIYNRNEFQEYLYVNTKLEQASTTRYDFGKIYEAFPECLIRLNLQIRFC